MRAMITYTPIITFDSSRLVNWLQVSEDPQTKTLLDKNMAKNKSKLILSEERVDPLEVEGDGDVDDAVGVGNRDDQRHTN